MVSMMRMENTLVRAVTGGGLIEGAKRRRLGQVVPPPGRVGYLDPIHFQPSLWGSDPPSSPFSWLDVLLLSHGGARHGLAPGARWPNGQHRYGQVNCLGVVAQAGYSCSRCDPFVLPFCPTATPGARSSHALTAGGADADACVHTLYSAGGAAVGPVAEAFPGTTANDGSIDRAALGAAVLQAGRDMAMKQLEAIVHPLVLADRQRFIREAAEGGEWMVVLDIPLLFETHPEDESLRREVDAVVVVSAPPDVQRARVLARPGMAAEKFEAILARQIPDATKRSRADYVIDTGFDGYAEPRAQLCSTLAALASRHSPAFER